MRCFVLTIFLSWGITFSSHAKALAFDNYPFDSFGNYWPILDGNISYSTTQKSYGIFLGDSDSTADGAKDAEKLRAQMVKSGLLSSRNAVTLLNDQITVSAIETTISNFNLTKGDRLYFFFSGHGGNVTGSGETTATPADEYITLSNDPYLITDDQITGILSKYNSIDKWVMLDSCFSGGFWGNNQENGGDLESLKHIALLAASSETEYSHSLFTDQSGIFTRGLIRAFTKSSSGYLRADSNKSGVLTFVELAAYLDDIDWIFPDLHSYAYLKDGVGDVVWLDESSYSKPITISSDDFVGEMPTDQFEIPTPATLPLIFIGLIGLLLIQMKFAHLKTTGRRNSQSYSW